MSWFGAQKIIVKIVIILALLGGGTGLVFIVQNNREDKDSATDTKENIENRIVKPPKGIGTQEEELDTDGDTEDLALAPNLGIGGDIIPPIAKRRARLKKPTVSPITIPSPNQNNIIIPNTPIIPNIPELPIVAPVSKFPIQAGALGSIDFDGNIGVFPDGSKLIGGSIDGKIVLSSNITLNSTDGDTYVAKIDNAGNYIWAKSFTINRSNGIEISTLSDGSSIISGRFLGQAIFGTITLTSVDGADDRDVYIAKIDANGDFVWARQIGGSNEQNISGIQVQADGASIIAGEFYSEAIFGATTLNAADLNDDGYITKIDVNGDFVWVRQIEGLNTQYVHDVQLQADGSSIVSGAFFNQAIFGTTTLNAAAGQWDLYIAKIDTNGDFVWVRQIGGDDSEGIGDIKVQADGSTFIGGQFRGEVVFGSTTLTPVDLNPDGFLTKIDSDGNFVWTHQIGGIGYQEITHIYIQENRSIMVGGYFLDTAIVGTTTLTAIDGDAFVANINSEGSVQWAAQIGGTHNQNIETIQVQADGSSIISGSFFNQAIFGTTTLTDIEGNYDSYITKIDSDGNFVWVRQIGGIESQYIGDVQIQSDNTIMIVGDFFREAMIGDNHLFDISDTNRAFIAILNADGTVNKAQSIGLGIGGSITLQSMRSLVDDSTLIRGIFTGTVNFGNITLSTADSDIPHNEQRYIAKIDKYGNYLWAKSIGGFESDSSISIRLQDNGKTIVYGDFYDTAIFGDNVFTTTDNFRDGFMGIVNTNGEYDFIKQIGGEGDQWIDEMQLQSDGSSIVTGAFYNEAIVGATTLTALDNNIDTYITKIDTNGEYLWVNQVGGIEDQYINTTEGQTDGSIIIDGRFTNQLIWGTTTLTSTDGGWDQYIAKIDSNGNTMWLNQIGGASEQYIEDRQVQADGSYIIMGAFYNEIILGAITLTAVDGDGYIAKIDVNGNFVWARQVGGVGDQDTREIQVQADGSHIIVGSFYNQAILGTTTLTAVDGGEDSYITKIDVNGNFVWATQVGGVSQQYIYDTQVHTDGSTIITGYNGFNGDIVLGDIILSATGSVGDQYIAKIDASGEFVWANRIGGFNWNDIRQIVLQEDGSSIVYGDFQDGPATFGTTTLMPNGEGSDVYIAKMDSDGNYVWVRQIGGIDSQWIHTNEQIQADGSIIFTGGFWGQAILGTTTLTAVDGGEDGYIAKIDKDGNFAWVSQVGGVNDQEIDRVRMQSNGSIIVGGDFSREIIFSQPGLPSQSLLRTSRNGDIFIAKLNPNGVWE